MYIYAAYGLTIRSEIELPGLPEGEEPCAVTIRYGKVPPLSTLMNHSVGANRVWGSALGRLRFLVEGGEAITIEVERPLEEGVVRAVVLGVLMAALLRQRGLLVIHASGVVKHGRAVGFIGASGQGKSTLAEFFCKHGYRMLGDDALAIRTEGNHPVAVPGPPLIQLRPEAGRWLRDDFESLPRVHTGSQKGIRPAMDVFHVHPAPLARLYVLEEPGEGESAIVPMTPQAALLALIHHTRAQNLLTAPAYARANLNQCADVVRRVPVSRLRRERGLLMLRSLLDVVERDLQEHTRHLSSPA